MLDIKGFTLVNPDKVERALHGTPVPSGARGGIANDDGTYEEDKLLAEYDRLGGLIRKGGDTVKTGSFYDFGARRPHAIPKVVFVYRVNGDLVEVPEGVELPGEVKAVRVLEAKNKESKKKKCSLMR